ncbi:MAG: exonuclease SbcC, partial [Muribaculaceae bacterium]|nr:exonuclease SbcC [Muribaculaceae bacterium]
YRRQQEKWDRLNLMFGSRDGKKFRAIAQSYVLGHLVDIANGYMRHLMPRYKLRVQPGTFVILVEDSYQGGELRPASSISGGETFVVSLALALALSDMSGKLSMDMLFIDEGFGTLSGEALRRAVDTLRSLHGSKHRRVGIISHVEELRECIDVQIQLRQENRNGASEICICG